MHSCGRLAGLLVGPAVLLLGLAPPVAAGRSSATERLYVTVVDAKGRPVTGLTADDFAVRIDDANQEVAGLGPALEPASVVVLTDRLGLNATYTPFDVGQTLREFAGAIRKGSQDAKLALTTFDGTVLQVAKFGGAPAELDRALGRLATGSDDAVLLDGLADACQVMRSAPSSRRIIFTLVAAYRPDHSTMQPDVVGEILRLSGASLWVVEVRQAQGGNYGNPIREQILDNGSRLSGGFREIVSSRSGLNTAVRHMAELILAQYVLTYGPGGGSSRSIVAVTVKRPGVRVLTAGWTSR